MCLTDKFRDTTKCNGILCVSVGISADQNLSFREFLYPLKRNQASSLKRTGVGFVSSARTAWSYQFTKLNYSQFLSQSLWTTCLLRGCKRCSVVPFRTDGADSDTPLCCWSRNSDFLGVPIQAPISSCFPRLSPVFCTFCHCIQCNLLLRIVQAIVTSPVWNRHGSNIQLSELATILAGSVFSVSHINTRCFRVMYKVTADEPQTS
jgi:hypothetical protein